MGGYLHRNFAESLGQFGKPRLLPDCEGWLLERTIPGSPHRDAMGCYPIFCCRDWSRLQADVEQIGPELVSLSLVTDPFGGYDENLLRRCFPDVAAPFKRHFVVDLTQSPLEHASEHHRRNARKALGKFDVERCGEPADFLEDWVSLYSDLCEKHGISGIPAFSRTSFQKQLAVPGITAFRAVLDGKTAAMLLWYVQGEIAYYHLGASSNIGYQYRASFALFWHSIEHFSSAGEGLRWASLGAGAGAANDGTDGLTRFKQGWATGNRTAYFCGIILNKKRYLELTGQKEKGETNYFPAYRQGEFA